MGQWGREPQRDSMLWPLSLRNAPLPLEGPHTTPTLLTQGMCMAHPATLPDTFGKQLPNSPAVEGLHHSSHEQQRPQLMSIGMGGTTGTWPQQAELMGTCTGVTLAAVEEDSQRR